MPFATGWAASSRRGSRTAPTRISLQKPFVRCPAVGAADLSRRGLMAHAVLTTMAGFRSPLDAYREDLSRAPGRKRLGNEDEYWIILATGLRRLAQAPSRSRPAAARRLAAALTTLEAQLVTFGRHESTSESARAGKTGSPSAVAGALERFPDPGTASALVAEVRGAAADAEESGAVALARETLTDLLELSVHARPLDRGLILLQLGRIARTLGEIDAALDLLTAAKRRRSTGAPG